MLSASRRRLLLVLPALVVALLIGAAPGASSQCLGPDNLDLPGACCQPVIPTLPPFPAASLPGLGVCWNQCTVGTTNTLKVAWTAPTQPFCAEYSTILTVSDGTSGLPILTGPLVLDYTRTWNEIDNTGALTQVWRFTAKADLSFVTGGGVPPCPVPTCIGAIGAWPTAFYYGYVDYTSCTAAGPWENALVLYHACDRFIHMPNLSNRPGVFHPGRSYAIVAPHTALQPFIPMNTIAPGGPLFGEAMRNVNTIVPPLPFCISEDRIVGGTMTKLGAGCLCTLAQNPKQQTLREFKGQSQCVSTTGVPGSWTSLVVNFPVLPWFHMVTTSIGSWSSPLVYPGKESAWVDEGLFVHQDACTGDFVELKYGGSTKDGWPVLLPIPVVVTNFTDVVDNYSAPLLGPYPMPVLGTVNPSNHLIYVNEP